LPPTATSVPVFCCRNNAVMASFAIMDLLCCPFSL
jgi:hypothetical protein